METNTASADRKYVKWMRPAVFASAFLSVVLIFYWGVSRAPQDAFDDAYITYRYADNFRRGLGLVYNPGEWVLGTTTPLFALLLGGLGLVVSDLEVLGHWVGVVGWMLAALLTVLFFWQEKRPIAALIAPLLVAVQPTFYTSLGMETPLLVALMLAVAVFWLRGNNKKAVILAALLILTRYDSSLWLLIVGLEVARRRRQAGQSWINALPWREGLATLGLTLPWFVFSYFRYGSPLPNSAAAKFGQANLMPVEGQRPFALALFESWFESLPPLSLVILVGVFLIAIYLIVRRLNRFGWLLVWVMVYGFFYTIIGVVNFPWYFGPPITILSLVLALGLGSLLGDDVWRERPSTSVLLSSGMRYGAALICLGIIFFSLAMLTLNRQNRGGYRPSYLEAGQWLRENTAEEATVATIEIGVIGYHSQRPILDTQGLVSQDMTGHQVGWDDTLVYALNAHKPDYALALPGTAWDIVTAQWWFRRDYEVVERFGEATLYGRKAATSSPVTTDISMAYPPLFVLDELLVERTELEIGRPITGKLAISVTQSSLPPIRITSYLVHSGTFERFAVTDFYPFENLYPSEHWQKGDRLEIPFRLEMPEGLPWGAFRVGFIFHNTGDGFPIINTNRTTEIDAGLLTFGQPDQAALPDLNFQAIDQAWSNGMTLNGLGLPGGALSPGDDLPIQFLWDTTARPVQDWTYFIHIVDGRGEIVTQLDQRPWNGRWPTTAWRPNQPFYETASFVLPEDISPGRYGIRLGFYIFDERLPLAGETADFFFLPDIIFVEP